MNATSRTECKRNEATRVTSVHELVKSATVYNGCSGTSIEQSRALCNIHATTSYFTFPKSLSIRIIAYFFRINDAYSEKRIDIFIVDETNYGSNFRARHANRCVTIYDAWVITTLKEIMYTFNESGIRQISDVTMDNNFSPIINE